MAEASNNDNNSVADFSYQNIDSDTTAVPGISIASEVSFTSSCGRSTGAEHGSHLGDQGRSDASSTLGSQLFPNSDNAQDFLLTGIGGLGFPDLGSRMGVQSQAEYPDTIHDELLLTGDVQERHQARPPGSVDDPWSGVDFCVPESNLNGVKPSFCSRGRRLTTQTQLFIKHFLHLNPTGCMDHVESNCIHPHTQYTIAQRVFEAMYVTLAAVAMMAICTLQAHGLQLTWMVICGLFLSLAAVLVLIRMLLMTR